MTGKELKEIRLGLGLSVIEFAIALGYVGNRNTLNVAVRRYEGGQREIPPWIERLAIMFDLHGVPKEFLERTEN